MYSIDRGTFRRPQDVLPEEVLRLFGEEKRSDSFSYGHEQGDKELRGMIARGENQKHGTSYSEENIAMMPGAWAGLEFVLQEIMDMKSSRSRDGCIIIVGPTLYQMFYGPITFFGMDIRAYDFTKKEKIYTPEKEDIEGLFEHKPKVIVLTNPNNPNGIYTKNDVLKQIIEEAKKRDAYVIIDEMQNFLREPELRYGSWIQSPHVIRIDSPSKRYGMADQRVGWVIADKRMLGNRMEGIIGRMSSMMGNAPRSANTALKYILKNEIEWRMGGDDMFAEVKKGLKEKEEYVCKRLGQMGRVKEIMKREGCINQAVRLDGGKTDKEIAEKLMEQGVLITPGSGYGYDPEDAVLRITFAERIKEKLKPALDIVEATLSKMGDKTP